MPWHVLLDHFISDLVLTWRHNVSETTVFSKEGIQRKPSCFFVSGYARY